MKHILTLAVMLLLLGCATAMPTPSAQGRPVADEAAIRALEEAERLGVLNQDFPALEAIWSEHFMVNSPANQVSPTRDAVLDVFRRGLTHYSSFERRIERIRFDGDIAVVMGGETVQPTGNAPQAGQTVQRRFTHVWKHEDGRWRLIARHANNIAPQP